MLEGSKNNHASNSIWENNHVSKSLILRKGGEKNCTSLAHFSPHLTSIIKEVIF